MTVKIIADSTYDGNRLITVECVYPRIIHSQVLRHRNFSHSVASSRAIPTKRIIEEVERNPYIPRRWGANGTGMSPRGEVDGQVAWRAEDSSRRLLKAAIVECKYMHGLGVHKQHVNRYLEPWMYVTDLVTGTEATWQAFLDLRWDEHAQYECQDLSDEIRDAMAGSVTRELHLGEWHMPFVDHSRMFDWDYNCHDALRLSAARCARVSYLRQNDERSIEDDLNLASRLIADKHWSPFEHQARPMKRGEEQVGNLAGWRQQRHEI